MGALVLIHEDEKHVEICNYLNADNEFWIKNDVWRGDAKVFEDSEIYVNDRAKTWTIADFTTFKQESVKMEMKYFILKRFKENGLSSYGCSANYLRRDSALL